MGRDVERRPRSPERTHCREGASDPPLEDRIKDRDVTRFFGGLKMLVSNVSNGQQKHLLNRRRDLSVGTAERAGVGARNGPKGHQSHPL